MAGVGVAGVGASSWDNHLFSPLPSDVNVLPRLQIFSVLKMWNKTDNDSHQAQRLDFKHTWRLFIENLQKHGCVSRWCHILDDSLRSFIEIGANDHHSPSDQPFERILLRCPPIN